MGQVLVLKGLWPLLMLLFVTDAVSVGSMSVNSHGTSGQLGSLFSQYAPGLDKMMRKLGLKSDRSYSEEDEADEERRAHRKKRHEKMKLAEEGERLQEEYYRREKEQPENDEALLDTESLHEKRHSSGFNKLRKRLARKERQQDDSEEDQERDSREDRNREDLDRETYEREDRDRDSDAQDDGYPTTEYGAEEGVESEDTTSPSRRKARDDTESLEQRRSELDELSDIEIARKNMHSADEEDESRSKRRRSETDDTVEDDASGSDSTLIRRERAHRRHDDEREDLESDKDDHRIEDADGEETRSKIEKEIRKKPEEAAELSEVRKARETRGMKEAFSETSASQNKNSHTLFKVGEDVRSFHNGLKQWQSARIESLHEDGSMTVNWESGSNEHRQVKAAEVAKIPVWGSDNPYRFEGANPYDIFQEQQNKVNGHAMTPSTKTNTKAIFDGYTLFTPSESE